MNDTVTNISDTNWHYIIVGGGSAGCVLARRLSEDPGTNVLLLEAGGEVDDVQVSIPQAWPALAGGQYDWDYSSTSQVGLADRSVAQPRGKGLGGSTLINAMGHQRGAHQAYDSWAKATDDSGWSYASLLPYFRKSETASEGANEFRGGDGPQHVMQLSGAPDLTPLARSIAAAGIAAGYPENPDWNGAREDGTVFSQLTIKNNTRHTAAAAFIEPVRSRKNLSVKTQACVQKIEVENNACVGVTVVIDGKEHLLKANHETIVSAGALDSPRLLLLSGIGEASHLEKLGIKVVKDLPGVGQNLHDHPLAPGMLYRSSKTIPVSNYNHCECLILPESSRSPGWSDLMIMGLSVPFISPSLGTPPENSFAFVPALTYPRSRGRLSLISADPNVAASIDPAYLKEQSDVEALVDCIEIGRDIAAQPALQEWIEEEVFPGPEMTNRKELAEHVRRVASPFFHPVSTCAMGRETDKLVVLDSSCRVRGIAGLRVVDASAFPSIPQAMTNAAVLALAERAADIILDAV